MYQKFPVWRSHWTSGLVSLHAKPALTDAEVLHELPSGAPVSSGALRGKIVFSLRGAIPFVEKAKRVAVRVLITTAWDVVTYCTQ